MKWFIATVCNCHLLVSKFELWTRFHQQMVLTVWPCQSTVTEVVVTATWRGKNSEFRRTIRNNIGVTVIWDWILTCFQSFEMKKHTCFQNACCLIFCDPCFIFVDRGWTTGALRLDRTKICWVQPDGGGYLQGWMCLMLWCTGQSHREFLLCRCGKWGGRNSSSLRQFWSQEDWDVETNGGTWNVGRCGKGAERGCSEHLFYARIHDFLMSGKGTFGIIWVFLWV